MSTGLNQAHLDMTAHLAPSHCATPRRAEAAPTNNQVEQQLRRAVTVRKLGGCNGSESTL